MKLLVVVAALLAFVGVSSSAAVLRGRQPGVPVAIYRGPASCADCPEAIARAMVAADPRYRIEFVGPRERHDVSAATLRRFRVYVQPGGGQDIDAALAALGGQRIAAIRAFVTRGGSYLGVCMGAYLADRSDIGLIGDDLDTEVGRPGSAARTEDDTAVPVRWGGRSERLYYQDGPFLPDRMRSAGFRSIARYGNGDVAAARYTVGQGTVVLSGPHPEADASWYDDADLPLGLLPQGHPMKVLLDELTT